MALLPTDSATAAIEQATAANDDVELLHDVDLMEFINGSGYALTGIQSESQETSV